MKIQHYDVDTPFIKPPQPSGWHQGWYGLYRLDECWSVDAQVELLQREVYTKMQGWLSLRQFEIDCFLSILADIKRDEVNIIEAGAGWGEWCLALAGVIRNKIIPIVARDYRCMAVEAEPSHYKWLVSHFGEQGVKGETVEGAVGRRLGHCYFNLAGSPSYNYGQTMSFTASNWLLGMIRLLIGRVVRVPVYTIDSLMRDYRYKHMDIVHMDVQGAECDVVEGALKSIKRGRIDYWLIGTHRRRFKNTNDKLRRLLEPYYDVVVDLPPNNIGQVDGLKPIQCRDGIQVYKRKEGKRE